MVQLLEARELPYKHGSDNKSGQFRSQVSRVRETMRGERFRAVEIPETPRSILTSNQNAND
jgi:hypothetical protein